MKKSKIYDYYVLVYQPSHPNRLGEGYVPEHILVAEKEIGRYLHPDEEVRHKNGDAHDNRPANLEIISAAKGYKILNLGEEQVQSKRTPNKTFMPCKFQKPCWKEVREPIARKHKVYIPYYCSYQELGDVYHCSRFWGYLEKHMQEQGRENKVE